MGKLLKKQPLLYINLFALVLGAVLLSVGFQNCFNLDTTLQPETINPLVDPETDSVGVDRNLATQESGLFISLDSDNKKNESLQELHNKTNHDYIIRSQQVQIKFEQIDVLNEAINKSRPASLLFNLFDDANFVISIDKRIESSLTGYTLFGRLENQLGQMTLVVNGDIVAGTLQTPNATYRILTAPDKKSYIIQEIDSSALPSGAEPLTPSFPTDRSDRSTQPSSSLNKEDGSRIDVAIFYTPLARQAVGGHDQIETLIDLMVAETNQAYIDSDVNQRIFAVTKEEVEYNEQEQTNPPDDKTDDKKKMTLTVSQQNPNILRRLRDPSDGFMDKVHIRRDELKADIVHLISVFTESRCGLAYILDPNSDISADPNLAFGYTVVYCPSSFFAHELGHNMGLLHDRYIYSALPSPNYNYGYVNQKIFDELSPPADAKWRTIMSYPDQCVQEGGFYCEVIMRFSNANQIYNGDPLGTLDESNLRVGPAHAQNILNQTKVILANFRTRSAGSDLVIQAQRIQIHEDKKVDETPLTHSNVAIQQPSNIYKDMVLHPGQFFTLSTTVYNIGLNASMESILYLYRLNEKILSASLIKNITESILYLYPLNEKAVKETRVVKALAVGEASLEQIRLKAPSTPGAHFYRFCINSKRNSKNSSSHNCSKWLSIQIEPVFETPVNGVCDNSIKYGCIAGTPNSNAIADTNTYYRWQCLGLNGGTTAINCQKAKSITKTPINGVCDNSIKYGCIAGTPNSNAIADTNTYYRWQCLGLNGGTTAINCQKVKSIINNQ